MFIVRSSLKTVHVFGRTQPHCTIPRAYQAILPSISSHYFGNAAVCTESKLPEISHDASSVMELIESYQTEPYHKKKQRTQRNIDTFSTNRKTKLQQMLEEKDLYHPVLYAILSAETSGDILQILANIDREQFTQDELFQDMDTEETITQRHLQPTIHNLYSKAIRTCADLGDLATCWKIFAQCKQDKIVSNELYNTMMWISMYNKRNSAALDRVFKLNEELEQMLQEHNLPPHPRTYSTMINSCTKCQKFNEAFKLYGTLRKQHPEWLKHERVVQALSHLFLATKHVNQAMDLLDEHAKIDAALWSKFEEYRLSEFLFVIASKLAYHADHHTQQLVETAETVFAKCVTAACRQNVPIPAGFFAGMVKVYARAADYDSCTALLRYMTWPSKKHRLFPTPTSGVYEQMLIALEVEEDEQEKWKKVEKLRKSMKRVEVTPSWRFYASLIALCGNDIERAKSFYDDMIEEGKYTPNMTLLQRLYDVGVEHYGQKKDADGLQEFTKWIMDEHRKYDIVPTQEIKEMWKRHLIQIQAKTNL